MTTKPHHMFSIVIHMVMGDLCWSKKTIHCVFFALRMTIFALMPSRGTEMIPGGNGATGKPGNRIDREVVLEGRGCGSSTPGGGPGRGLAVPG